MTSPYRPAATGTATVPQRPRPPSSRSPAPLPYSLNRINNQVNMRTPGVLISQFSKPELPLYHDPRLPPGWGRTIQKAPNGACFVVISTPDGGQFKNKEEIASYLQVSGAVPGLDPSKVDFSVFGKSM